MADFIINQKAQAFKQANFDKEYTFSDPPSTNCVGKMHASLHVFLSRLSQPLLNNMTYEGTMPARHMLDPSCERINLSRKETANFVVLQRPV